MRYPPQILDEIRARIPASDVVGRKVQLKKAGREWRGLSPFNAEKTPSFYVNDQKGFYHCFSSSKHGDIFTFLMEMEGLSFPEAVERLAGEAGVELPRSSPEAVRQEVQRRGLHEVLELATAFFEAQLAGRAGRAAREYLDRRDITPELRARFRLGYASSERFGLRDYLAGKDVPSETMIEAGLLVSGPDVSVPFDRFRDRVIFPIDDSRGRPVAFGGRAMSADVPAKYLNSPYTPLFSKGRLLYNHHRARAGSAGPIVAVEGYVDVIALAGIGIEGAVAPLGTALTEDQLALLWRMADEPILCFDGDKAGRRAAFRAVDVALPNLPSGKSLRFAFLPDGQDPDDLARSGGRPALDRVLAAATPLVDALWARELETIPPDTPERRAGLARRLRDAMAVIKDETLRRFYRAEIESRLSALSPDPWRARRDAPRRPSTGRGGGSGGSGGGHHPPAALRASPALARSALFAGGGGVPRREALIVAALFGHPHLLHDEADRLAGVELVNRDARAIADLLLDSALHEDVVDSAVLQSRIDRAGLHMALETIRVGTVPGDRWILEPAADPVRLEGALRQAFTLQRRSRTLHTELRAAERALAEDNSDANLMWLREVQAEIQSVDGAEADTAS